MNILVILKQIPCVQEQEFMAETDKQIIGIMLK